MATGNYNPFRFLDPASQRTTGRGGVGTSLGGQTFLGAAPVPQSVAPAGGTRLAPSRRRSFLPQGSLITGTGGSGSMGRRQPVGSGGQRTPSFLSSTAYYNARGSDLDRLERYGPDRTQNQGADLGQATYGGRTVGPAPAAQAAPVDQSIGASLGSGLSTDSPYTALTGDAGSTAPVMDSSPLGRYNRMGAEQSALAAEGLEAGRAAAAQVRGLQEAEAAPSGTINTAGPFRVARTPFGTAISSVGRNVRKSFGRFGSPTVEADRQAEIGERAIASRARRGISERDLLNSYSRRFAQ